MFFKTTLTVPKFKDLVNSPNKKYQNIYDTLSHTNSNLYAESNDNSYTNIDLLPSEAIPTMKDELKSFLKKQLNNDTTANDNVIGMAPLSGGNFSNF
jgi:hypothetical protein